MQHERFPTSASLEPRIMPLRPSEPFICLDFPCDFGGDHSSPASFVIEWVFVCYYGRTLFLVSPILIVTRHSLIMLYALRMKGNIHLLRVSSRIIELPTCDWYCEGKNLYQKEKKCQSPKSKHWKKYNRICFSCYMQISK